MSPEHRPDSSVANFEKVLGAAVMRREIDAKEAYDAMGNYAIWVALGEPKFSLSILNVDRQPGQVGGVKANPTLL